MRLDGDYRFAKSELARVYAHEHQCGKALATIPSTPSIFGSPEDLWRPYTWARCGEQVRAKQYLDSLESRARRGIYVAPFFTAIAYAALQDRVAAFRWLEKAVDEDEWSLFELRHEPIFKAYHADRSFRRSCGELACESLRRPPRGGGTDQVVRM